MVIIGMHMVDFGEKIVKQMSSAQLKMREKAFKYQTFLGFGGWNDEKYKKYFTKFEKRY